MGSVVHIPVCGILLPGLLLIVGVAWGVCFGGNLADWEELHYDTLLRSGAVVRTLSRTFLERAAVGWMVRHPAVPTPAGAFPGGRVLALFGRVPPNGVDLFGLDFNWSYVSRPCSVAR